MFPTVAIVVEVGEGFARAERGAERDAIFTLDQRRGVVVWIGYAVVVMADDELVQVTAGPAHRPQQHHMEFVTI